MNPARKLVSANLITDLEQETIEVRARLGQEIEELRARLDRQEKQHRALREVASTVVAFYDGHPQLAPPIGIASLRAVLALDEPC